MLLLRSFCMICPSCKSQVAPESRVCGRCGAPLPVNQQFPPPLPGGYRPPGGAYPPPNQDSSHSILGNSVPRAEQHNSKGPLRIADITISIDGELVPVVDIMLGNQMPIYF